jgi:hypothetical protein
MADLDEEFDEAFDEVRKAFHERVEEFRADFDLPYGLLSILCAQMSVTARMLDYLDSVEKPSAAGLRLELDRLLRGIESTVRAAKKRAEQVVAVTKQAAAEARGGETSE